MNIKYIEKNTDAVVEYYDEITSTNDRAREIAELALNEKEDKKHPNLIIAETQTRGKGTNGRAWLSNNGKNILMTMIFYPQKAIKELDGITYKIAEIVKESIRDLYNIELTIKLPNDLLLNNKKISGILTESSILDKKVNYLIIGIGFNVNQVIFPKELEDIATSLKKECGVNNYKREDIIIKIFNYVKSLF